MEIKATLSLSYKTNDEQRSVEIRIREENSRKIIFCGSVSYEEFTAALATLQFRSFIEAQFTDDATAIGKYLEMKDATIQAPFLKRDHGGPGGYRLTHEAWLREHGGEPGWLVDPYLGSRGSITSNKDGALLSYSLYRYVDKPPEKEPCPTKKKSQQ